MIDLVICGPDLSGKGTQIEGIICFLKSLNKTVRDLRGTEIEALFQAEVFFPYNQNYFNLKQFLNDPQVSLSDKKEVLYQATQLLINGGTNQDLKVASLVKNEITTYINPNSAEVWIMEEPPKRGSGQVNRTIEQHRSRYGLRPDHDSAAKTHQVYRLDEFLRFRKILRERNKTIIRSRSEESACYNIYDQQANPTGIKQSEYLNLPGHRLAFANPPTHIFVVCANQQWTEQEYQRLREERSKGRLVDDYETKTEFQVLVNHRYASSWLEELYQEACSQYHSTPPQIFRFDIYDTPEQIKFKLISKLKEIMGLF